MADNTVAITAGSGTLIRTITNAGIDSGAHQQVFSIGNSDGTLNGNDPDGTFQTDDGPSNLLFEAFDGTLATQWTVSGSASPTQANGALTFASSTATASYTSLITGINPLSMTSASYLQSSFVVQLETTASVTNNTRWWGYGTNAASPTAAAPITNGAVFMLDYSAGTFYAAIYSAGTRTQTVTLTKPTDGAFHRYAVWYRTSRAYFIMDGVTVATIQFPNTAVSNNQFLIGGSANFTTAPTVTPTLVWSSASAADGGDNNTWLSDATTPSVRATIKKSSTASAATDTALVVGLHPSSPLPAGSSTIGSINTVSTVTTIANISQINGNSAVGYTLTTAASTNAVSPRAAACSLFELSISNPTTTACYVKVYNKSSAPTVGTDVPVMTIRIPATGTAGDFTALQFGANGKRLSAGLALAVTGAAVATDTTATVAGVQVSLTYV